MHQIDLPGDELAQLVVVGAVTVDELVTRLRLVRDEGPSRSLERQVAERVVTLCVRFGRPLGPREPLTAYLDATFAPALGGGEPIDPQTAAGLVALGVWALADALSAGLPARDPARFLRRVARLCLSVGRVPPGVEEAVWVAESANPAGRGKRPTG
jgi:hypothetical protein